MELKTARLTLLIDPDKKAAFEHLCARQDRTASQVVRQLIRDYLVAHGVAYGASDIDHALATAGSPPRASLAKPKPGPRSRAVSSAARAGPRRR
jgi:hypothetical protein